MDISKLSTDSLRNICEFFLEENLVTEAQLLQIAASRPSNELKYTVDLIHTCFCQKDHDADCNYLMEEQRAECWTMPDHREWLDTTTNLMTDLQLSENALRQACNKALGLLKEYDNLDKSARVLFHKLLAM